MKLVSRGPLTPYEYVHEYLITRKPRDLIIDLGCGDGTGLSQYHHDYKNLIGLDRTPRRGPRPSNLTVFTGDASTLQPFHRPDVILCFNTIEYFLDPLTTLQAWTRHLLPDGVFCVSVPNIAFLPKRIRMLWGGLPRASLHHSTRLWDDGMLHYYTLPETRLLLADAGLTILHEGTTGHYPHLRGLWPSLLGWDLLFICKKRPNMGRADK